MPNSHCPKSLPAFLCLLNGFTRGSLYTDTCHRPLNHSTPSQTNLFVAVCVHLVFYTPHLCLVSTIIFSIFHVASSTLVLCVLSTNKLWNTWKGLYKYTSNEKGLGWEGQGGMQSKDMLADTVKFPWWHRNTRYLVSGIERQNEDWKAKPASCPFPLLSDLLPFCKPIHFHPQRNLHASENCIWIWTTFCFVCQYFALFLWTYLQKLVFIFFGGWGCLLLINLAF